MLYVKRDAWGNLERVEPAPFAEMNGELVADSQEAQAWFANQTVETSLLQLKQSDLDMIRVLEDLISALMQKGVLRITDLPEAAQAKLVGRSRARDALGGAHSLISDDEDSGLI
ncbi:tryptophan synthase subunit beta [Pseudomonas sp. zbq_18]|uniref:tryptophan synthase subunit beta n=1 Tax=Pseudomonas sp. zbq_18 TaxID=3367251 RepID=UPI00370C617D